MKFLVTIIISFLSVFLIAQNSKSLDRHIEIVNTYLEAYAQLSPYDDSYYALKTSGLPKKRIKQIKNDPNYGELSKNRDSINNQDLIYEFQDLIVEQVNTIVLHPKFAANTTQKLHDELSIVTSENHKLYNFSLDAKNGGTYRAVISWMHYTEMDSALLNVNSDDSDEHNLPDVYDVFEGDGYYEIYTIETSEETKYLLFRNVKTCSTCFFSYIQLVSIEDNHFKNDYEFEIDYRMDNVQINYDHEVKTIQIIQTTDDLTEDCYCVYDDYLNYKDNKSLNTTTEASKTLQCECMFKFNGNTFELIKSCWEQIKD